MYFRITLELSVGDRATASTLTTFSIVKLGSDRTDTPALNIDVLGEGHEARAQALAKAINRIFAEPDVARKTAAQSEIAAIVKQAAE